jgi:hypothetical protein
MSRKDRSTMIALGMSSAVRDLPTKLRCALLDEEPDTVEFTGLISWYERRERERKEADRVTRAQA